MQNNLPTEIEKLLKSWRHQIEKNENKHRKNALWFRRGYYGLGVPATLLSGLFTAGSLASISGCASAYFVLCITQSVCGAIVTGLIGTQTYMQMMSRFMNNKLASDRYQALLRTIEIILNTPNQSDPANILANIQKTFDDIVTTSPMLPVENTKLKFLVFDRDTRKKTVPQSKRSIEEIEEKQPATKEELDKINGYVTDEEKEICIDEDVAERMSEFYIDPELKYQMDRLYENNV